MFLHFPEQVSVAQAVPPSADAFDSTVNSDVMNFKLFSKVVFLILKGNGATGTSTITINACDDITGANPVAIPFATYKSDADGQNMGARTERTSSGFTTTAEANKNIIIELQADQLPTDKPCAFLSAVEVVNSPVPAAIVALGFGGRYQQAPPKALTV
jgi:hypothetical protein